MDSRDDPDDLLESMDMKGVDVETKGNTSTNINVNSTNENIETKGNLSTDLNTFTVTVELEVPGKRTVIP